MLNYLDLSLLDGAVRQLKDPDVCAAVVVIGHDNGRLRILKLGDSQEVIKLINPEAVKEVMYES